MADTLGMTRQEMLELGHLVVEMVVDHLVHREEEAVVVTKPWAELRSELGGAVPLAPGDPASLLLTLKNLVLKNMQHKDHPRYFARVPGPSSFAAVLGEWLSTGFNANATSWEGDSGPSAVELVVIGWMAKLLGFPEDTPGILTSGGSTAAATGLFAALHHQGRGVVYMSDQTHDSNQRALQKLGVPREDIRMIKTDGQGRLNLKDLIAAIQLDREEGRPPVIVIGNAGTTNTGAIDPLLDIAELCKKEGLWLHVDGAYGAAVALLESGRAALRGIELADSLVVDPHKWLFQPIDVGCVLIRHKGLLEKAFGSTPEYLKDLLGQNDEIDFRNRGLELTRRARSLKIWMTFKTYGLQKITQAIARGIALAEYAEELVRERSERWTLVTPARIGIVTFARKTQLGSEEQEKLHSHLVREISKSGFATLSSTKFLGRNVLRLCTINPLTTNQDIAETLDRLESIPFRTQH